MNIYRSDDFFRDSDMVYISPVNQSTAMEEPHMHEFLELVYIYGGAGCHSIDGQVFQVTKGDLIFINLGQTHAILSGGMQCINCLLRPEFLSETLVNPRDSEVLFSLALFDGFDREFDHSRCVVRFQGEDLLELHSLFGYMVREAAARQKGYQFVLSGYMRVVLSKMVRALDQDSRAVTAGRLNMEIIQYVNEHCFGQFSLRQLAEKYFYNPNYLSTKFREVSGKSLSSYIRERRMDEAVRLLTETSLSVEAVSNAVGYLEKGHFYAAFKRHTGMTPNQYRNAKRNQI